MHLARALPAAALSLLAIAAGACGSSDASPDGATNGADGGAVTDPVGQPGTDRGRERDGAAGDATTGKDASATSGDPESDGAFATAEKDATATIATSGDSVAIHAVYPSAAPGPFPIVVIGHGFQLPPSQYYGYAKRLASFGYVALTVDFPASFVGMDNTKQAKDMIGGIDWAKADATLGPKVDATKAGMTGHSLGGKIALLAATQDARVKAAFVLDPVDGGAGGCMAPACVNVAPLMAGLAIPTGFLGETTDATGSFQACAPAASNYTTFYATAKTPSLQVTALGANHMSFLDDVSTCGVTCSFCNSATAPNAQVTKMARALMTAFFERHLRGDATYDAYLTGTQAQARYVMTTQATIVSK